MSVLQQVDVFYQPVVQIWWSKPLLKGSHHALSKSPVLISMSLFVIYLNQSELNLLTNTAVWCPSLSLNESFHHFPKSHDFNVMASVKLKSQANLNSCRCTFCRNLLNVALMELEISRFNIFYINTAKNAQFITSIHHIAKNYKIKNAIWNAKYFYQDRWQLCFNPF